MNSALAVTSTLTQPFKDCKVKGSITLYDKKQDRWFYSDRIDANRATLPASTFKIINSLIALDTGVVKDEQQVFKWDGTKRDISIWNKDHNLKQAYQHSAVWVYQEIAREVGKKRYAKYLKAYSCGNQNLESDLERFWLDGSLKITPINQVELLRKFYEEQPPFSRRSYQILKPIMLAEKKPAYSIYAKTGWGKVEAKDIGWWIGYLETKDNTIFFATRIWKYIEISNKNFTRCRKTITKKVLKDLKFIS